MTELQRNCKPVPCTNSFRKKRLSILASCMANLSKFNVVFSSSTRIRLDKDAFEGHLCQTVNNFVKQNESSLLCPLRKRRPPQHIKHIRNTRVSRIPSETLEYLEYLHQWSCSIRVGRTMRRVELVYCLHDGSNL